MRLFLIPEEVLRAFGQLRRIKGEALWQRILTDALGQEHCSDDHRHAELNGYMCTRCGAMV